MNKLEIMALEEELDNWESVGFLRESLRMRGGHVKTSKISRGDRAIHDAIGAIWRKGERALLLSDSLAEMLSQEGYDNLLLEEVSGIVCLPETIEEIRRGVAQKVIRRMLSPAAMSTAQEKEGGALKEEDKVRAIFRCELEWLLEKVRERDTIPGSVLIDPLGLRYTIPQSVVLEHGPRKGDLDAPVRMWLERLAATHADMALVEVPLKAMARYREEGNRILAETQEDVLAAMWWAEQCWKPLGFGLQQIGHRLVLESEAGRALGRKRKVWEISFSDEARPGSMNSLPGVTNLTLPLAESLFEAGILMESDFEMEHVRHIMCEKVLKMMDAIAGGSRWNLSPESESSTSVEGPVRGETEA